MFSFVSCWRKASNVKATVKRDLRNQQTRQSRSYASHCFLSLSKWNALTCLQYSFYFCQSVWVALVFASHFPPLNRVCFPYWILRANKPNRSKTFIFYPFIRATVVYFAMFYGVRHVQLYPHTHIYTRP